MRSFPYCECFTVWLVPSGFFFMMKERAAVSLRPLLQMPEQSATVLPTRLKGM